MCIRDRSCHVFQWLMRWNCLTDIHFTEWWGEMSSWLLHISVNDEVKCPCYSACPSEWWSEMSCRIFQWVIKEMLWLLHVSLRDDVKCSGCCRISEMSWLWHISVNCMMQNSVTVMCWWSEMSWLLHISVNRMMPNLRPLCTDHVKCPGCSTVQRMMRCSALTVTMNNEVLCPCCSAWWGAVSLLQCMMRCSVFVTVHDEVQCPCYGAWWGAMSLLQCMMRCSALAVSYTHLTLPTMRRV